MALGIRGANPIWVEVDLAGKLFDDTFYMWVLENEIPYAPATVYHDPDLNTAWTDPIQFLGNGTLPNDIYFESQVVYRLEFRQHVGLGAPSQSDPLIYLVENYVAGEGGSTPVNSVAFASSNQITNPQFALIDFTSPYTFTGTDPDPIHVAPGWYFEAEGTGTVTFTQVPLNDSNANPTNAPYALQLTLSGWNAGSVFLRQRFEQNGMLWADKIVSSSITARVQGANLSISASLVDSNGSTLGQVLEPITIDNAFNEFTDYATLGDTTNPDTPPAAYIDYKLALPSTTDIYVTSIQLVVQDLPVEPSFEQDSINRQIDHTYNTAYPIVPVGTIIDYFGFGTPAHYLPCDGATLDRALYQLLLAALTKKETATLTNGAATFTVANGAIYAAGMPIEGTGIPANTTISSISTNTITMNNNATVSGAQLLTFFSVNNGNGVDTFKAPDLTGKYLAGSGGSLFATNGVSASGGAASATLGTANLPPHTHTYINALAAGTAYTVVNTPGVGPFNVDSGAVTGNGPGTSTAFSILPPTVLSNKFIRYE